MSELGTYKIRGGIPSLKDHIKIFPDLFVRANDVVDSYELSLRTIAQYCADVSRKATVRGRLQGVLIGAWGLFILQIATRQIIEAFS